MSTILPFVSVLDDDSEARYPVTVYDDGICELSDEGDCSVGPTRFGDADFQSPVFCAKHFHALHKGVRKQSHLEPMTAAEMKSNFH